MSELNTTLNGIAALPEMPAGRSALELCDWSPRERERLNAVLAERDRQIATGERETVMLRSRVGSLAQSRRRAREAAERRGP